MRALITGGKGFVGTWLGRHLGDEGDEVVVIDHEADVTDAAGMAEILAEVAPDAVYHLAALTHVGRSWDDPVEVLRVNALGTATVLAAARSCGSSPRVLLVSSAEVYGVVTDESTLPLTEESALAPTTPYAATKVAAEFLGIQAHLGYGQPVVIARPFNHVGPGQASTFAVSGLAQRIVKAIREGRGELPVGNLTPRRDFTDVRDVVRAYRMLVVSGEPGRIYNVCSGQDVAIGDLAERLLALAGTDLRLVADPSLVRPVDVPVLRGSPVRLQAVTGWKPEIPLDDTLADVLAYWQGRPIGD